MKTRSAAHNQHSSFARAAARTGTRILPASDCTYEIATCSAPPPRLAHICALARYTQPPFPTAAYFTDVALYRRTTKQAHNKRPRALLLFTFSNAAKRPYTPAVPTLFAYMLPLRRFLSRKTRMPLLSGTFRLRAPYLSRIRRAPQRGWLMAHERRTAYNTCEQQHARQGLKRMTIVTPIHCGGRLRAVRRAGTRLFVVGVGRYSVYAYEQLGCIARACRRAL